MSQRIVMVALVATIHDFFGSSEASGQKKDVDGRPRAASTLAALLCATQTGAPSGAPEADHDERAKCASNPGRPGRALLEFANSGITSFANRQQVGSHCRRRPGPIPS